MSGYSFFSLSLDIEWVENFNANLFKNLLELNIKVFNFYLKYYLC